MLNALLRQVCPLLQGALFAVWGCCLGLLGDVEELLTFQSAHGSQTHCCVGVCLQLQGTLFAVCGCM